MPDEIAVLDVLLLVTCFVIAFCVGAWFGWEAGTKAHERTHVRPRE